MFRFEYESEDFSKLIKDWKKKQFARDTLKNKDYDLSVFSMLSEWRDDGAKSLLKVYQTCVSLGKVDASLAWIVGVSNSAWSLLGNMPEDIVRGIDYPIVSMVLGNPGTVIFDTKEDIAIINGEWRYCSEAYSKVGTHPTPTN